LLTDFGIAREVKSGCHSQETQDETGFDSISMLGVIDTSGTPGYMAPEAMCKLPHSFASDFFSIGIVVYEQMFRKRPYSGANKQMIRDNILAHQV
jgi:serine/threonine protein kinase